MEESVNEKHMEMLEGYGPNLLKECRDFDLFHDGKNPRIAEVLNGGQWSIGYDGKFRRPYDSLDWNAPWIHTRPKTDHRCAVQMLLFNTCGILPEECLNCYKVVVKPRTVKELIMLLSLQENKTQRNCKCGTEERAGVVGMYGGYFYNWGRDTGLECLDEIKALVAEYISPDVPVFLKRGCTEFEEKFGNSARWDAVCTEDMRAFYRAHVDRFVTTPAVGTPPHIRLHKVHQWLIWGNSIGDETALEFNNGDPFKEPYTMYVGSMADIAEKEE